MSSLADDIHDLLPQTQCTKCGYQGCRPYAEAIANNAAEINQCPPGGAAGIAKLAARLGRPVIPLNPVHGVEAPRRVAMIRSEWCIGCTLCIQACPVDAIVGAAKQMHTVIADWCTGCDLCVAPCPVACIEMISPEPPLPQWQARDAALARSRYEARQARLQREQIENEERLRRKAEAKLAELNALQKTHPDDPTLLRKQQLVAAAIERSKAGDGAV
ncbi:electron transport complex subunit RsxB [Parvibium lacunae]|uniref:electron transport complex subunit RsxB n=1 Tax=Parvibium lacunae TaxID=1888893 RepID=UPI001EFDDAF7|nr:electron transport complex subunit RsxB [Parvibium lacunae]